MNAQGGTVGPLAVGVDVGGTKVLAGVVDTEGRVVDRLQLDTPHRSQAPAVVEATIIESVHTLRRKHDVSSVGVGAAGFVDLAGTVLFAPHLPWRQEPLSRLLEERIGLSVVVDNDANVAAWAEARFGAGRGRRQTVCVTLGTGIGGALVLDGDIFRGANGLAGEFGHVQVVPEGRECECGQSGCWEQYCSGKALLRSALAQPGCPDVLEGPGVTAAARESEPWAVAAFEEVGAWLGIGIAGLVASFDPEIVVVGGGLSEAGDLLLDPARRAFADRLPGGGTRPEPRIVAAELGPDAGFIGAADLARRRRLPT